jgi:hypothetical protein
VTRFNDVVLTKVLLIRPVFTSREVVELTGSRLAVVSRHLGSLARRAVITRVTRGVWAQPRHPDFSPYAVVPYILRATRRRQSRDARGYISLLSALNLRGVIDQIPRAISVVTTKRLPTLRSPVGTYEFHQLEPTLVGGFEPYGQARNFDLATAEKALFDTLYLSVRKGRRFAHLPELEMPRTFRPREVAIWITRIKDARLRSAVTQRWRALRARLLPKAPLKRAHSASRHP